MQNIHDVEGFVEARRQLDIALESSMEQWEANKGRGSFTGFNAAKDVLPAAMAAYLAGLAVAGPASAALVGSGIALPTVISKWTQGRDSGVRESYSAARKTSALIDRHLAERLQPTFSSPYTKTPHPWDLQVLEGLLATMSALIWTIHKAANE